MSTEDIKIDFYLRRSKTKRNGESPIYMWVELHGKKKHISTKLSTPAESWCANTKQVIGLPTANDINAKLLDRKNQILINASVLLQSKKSFTLQSIVSKPKHESEPQGLLEFFDIRLGEIESQIGVNYSKSTYINYRSAFRHLSKFIKLQYRKKDVFLGDLNITTLDGYLQYLKSHGQCQVNSANKYMRALRAVLYQAKSRELIVKSPFENFQLKYEKSQRDFLLETELKAIVRKEITIPRIQVVRDIFLFSCFTGLSYTDMKYLESSHIKRAGAKKFLVQRRKKSKVEAVIPLLSQAEEILEKYLSLSLLEDRTYIFPAPSNQKVNAYLKEIADICGIEKNLTFHMARHTFATTVTLANEIPIESISKMMGHTSIKTTQIYAQVLNEKLSSDMDRISDKLNFGL